MLLSINDDCLRLIIEKLPLQDQISCFFACQRLKIITTEIWKVKKEGYILMKNFKNIRLTFFAEYVRCISPYVEQLHLEEIDLYYLENIVFPKVHTLLYNNEGNECWDKELNLIQNLFPKLTKLRLRSNFTGKILQNLTNLEVLELFMCTNLREEHFENIYLNLPKIKKLTFVSCYKVFALENLLKKIDLCETLEEIILDDEHFFGIHDKLFKLKKLRKFAFFSQDRVQHILELIIKKFGSVLHTMMIEGGKMWQADNFCQSIQKMIALRRLIIDNIKFREDQLKAIGESLRSTLEEFYCRNVSHINAGNYNGLLAIVRQCKKLKIIDVTGAKIDLNFVKRVAEIIASTNEERNQVLIMYCSGTKVKVEDLEVLQLPRKLQISFECKEFGFLDQSSSNAYVTCEWNTTDENH